MNKQNFNQLGGFPFETDILDWMQTAYSLFNALGAAVGNYGIISGCTVAGSTVSDGVVYIDGEIYKFIGGNITSTVRILETETSKIFENGDNKVVHYERYVTFASGAGSIPWSSFKKPSTLLNISDRLTTAEAKLATIAEGAEVNVQADYAQTNAALDDYIKNKPAQAFLMKGTFSIGDVTAIDLEKTITFSNVGTANYLVVGSLVSLSANFDTDNDVFWMVKSKTATSFKILLREVSQQVQNLQFNYALIPY